MLRFLRFSCGFRTAELITSLLSRRTLMYSYSLFFFERLQYNLIIQSVRMEVCGANEIIGFLSEIKNGLLAIVWMMHQQYPCSEPLKASRISVFSLSKPR